MHSNLLGVSFKARGWQEVNFAWQCGRTSCKLHRSCCRSADCVEGASFLAFKKKRGELYERGDGKRNRRQLNVVGWKFSHISPIQLCNVARTCNCSPLLSIRVCESVLSRVRKVNRSILHGPRTFILPLIHLRKLTCCNPAVIQKKTFCSNFITIQICL